MNIQVNVTSCIMTEWRIASSYCSTVGNRGNPRGFFQSGSGEQHLPLRNRAGKGTPVRTVPQTTPRYTWSLRIRNRPNIDFQLNPNSTEFQFDIRLTEDIRIITEANNSLESRYRIVPIIAEHYRISLDRPAYFVPCSLCPLLTLSPAHLVPGLHAYSISPASMAAVRVVPSAPLLDKKRCAFCPQLYIYFLFGEAPTSSTGQNGYNSRGSHLMGRNASCRSCW